MGMVAALLANTVVFGEENQDAVPLERRVSRTTTLVTIKVTFLVLGKISVVLLGTHVLAMPRVPVNA